MMTEKYFNNICSLLPFTISTLILECKLELSAAEEQIPMPTPTPTATDMAKNRRKMACSTLEDFPWDISIPTLTDIIQW